MARGKRRSTNTPRQWSSTQHPQCYSASVRLEAMTRKASKHFPPAPPTASPQLLKARELLQTLPSGREAFIRHLHRVRSEDPVQGPMNLHWLCSALAAACPPGTGRTYFLNLAEQCMHEAVVMRRVRQGWEKYRMTPWEVVHHTAKPAIPRYCSEPTLRSHIRSL